MEFVLFEQINLIPILYCVFRGRLLIQMALYCILYIDKKLEYLKVEFAYEVLLDIFDLILNQLKIFDFQFFVQTVHSSV